MRGCLGSGLAFGLALIGGSNLHAQSRCPIMDKVAERVAQKYQTTSCQQLTAERGHPPSAQKRRWRAAWSVCFTSPADAADFPRSCCRANRK